MKLRRVNKTLRGLVYECLETDVRLVKKLRFTSSTLFKFKSESHPAIEIDCNLIFLHGDNPEFNNKLSLAYFKSNKDRDEWLEKFSSAFEELKKYLKETYSNPNKEKEVDNSNEIIFSAYD